VTFEPGAGLSSDKLYPLCVSDPIGEYILPSRLSCNFLCGIGIEGSGERKREKEKILELKGIDKSSH
jgi:hypothetical protein